jgi:mono/diheme cytochrome c family protein
MKSLGYALQSCMLMVTSTAFFGCAPTEPPGPVPAPTESREALIAKLAGDATLGASDYQVHCKSCHGSAAQASAKIGAYARGSQQGFLAQILNGGRGMPKFDTLSDSQIANVYAYVKAQ